MKKFSLSFKFFVLAMALFVGMVSSCSLISSSEKKSSGQTSPLPADFVKVKMYLSNAESISRTINPNEISRGDIVKVILSAKYAGEMAGESGQNGTSSGTSSASSGPSITEDDLKEYEFLNLDKERVSYLEWNNESIPGKSAYEAFLLDGLYLEKGYYKFTLELYTERSTYDTNEHLSMIAESELIQVTSDTQKIDLGMARYAQDGNLCIKFEWNADSGDQSPFEKIEAGLFTLSSKGTEPYDQEQYADDPDYNGYKTYTTPYQDADNHTYFAYYSENEVPNGTYFIKYRVYSSTGEIINAFMDIVKIKGFKTEKTLTIDLDKVNWKGQTKLFDINIKTDENSDIDVTNNSEELKISGTTLIFTAPELDNYTYEWKIDGIVQEDEEGQPVNSNILSIDIYEENWVSGIYDISLVMKDQDGNILSYSAQLEWTRKIKVDFVTNKEDLEFQTQYFSEGGNLVLKNPALNEDGSLDASKNPTYGWYLDEEMRAPFTSFGKVPLESMTLYGRWYLTEIYVQGQGAAGTGEFAEGNTSGSASSGGTGSTGSGTSLAADGSIYRPFTSIDDALNLIKNQKNMKDVDGNLLSQTDYKILIDGYLNQSVVIGKNFDGAASLAISGAGFSDADER
ncbi:MAG: hypothetical protein K6E78_04530 [Treponema sp.]|nr:hypothetical protein [Treponema sp.]